IRFGLGQPAVSAFHPAARDFNPNLKPLPFDPKRAAELLDQAGWKDSNGDGIRDKNGVKFAFEFLSSNSSTVLQQVSVVLKEELRRAGIEMRERAVDFTLMMQT